MEPWTPWDADDEEIKERSVIREPLPTLMRPAIALWLNGELTTGRRQTSARKVATLQSALRIDLIEDDDAPDWIWTEDLVRDIMSRGDKVTLRVVDYLLADHGTGWTSMPPNIETLAWHLDTSSAAVQVVLVSGEYRLGRRMPEGVDEAVQASIDAAPPTSSRHLAKAMREIQSVDPKTSSAMTEAIRAVEAAAGPVVIPKDGAPRLSKIVSALRDKTNWSLVLQRRDDDHPDHRQVLIGMLETLAFAQRDRHSGAAPSPEEATAHVLLAALLVGWFSTGAVVMDE